MRTPSGSRRISSEDPAEPLRACGGAEIEGGRRPDQQGSRSPGVFYRRVQIAIRCRLLWALAARHRPPGALRRCGSTQSGRGGEASSITRLPDALFHRRAEAFRAGARCALPASRGSSAEWLTSIATRRLFYALAAELAMTALTHTLVTAFTPERGRRALRHADADAAADHGKIDPAAAGWRACQRPPLPSTPALPSPFAFKGISAAPGGGMAMCARQPRGFADLGPSLRRDDARGSTWRSRDPQPWYIWLAVSVAAYALSQSILFPIHSIWGNWMKSRRPPLGSGS